MSAAPILLSVDRLSKSYGGVHAVCGISFSLQAGESLALIGPNGAGKTTCFNMLNGQIARLFDMSAPRLARDEAERLLDLVGMSGHADRPCGELAYCDLKRLELAIALANEPKLLLMDEPTAGMAPPERIELMRLTARIAHERAIGVLFTEHDMDVVFEHADRILVLNRGTLIAEGAPEEVRRDAQARAIYLGEGLVYDARHHEGASE